MVFFAFLFLFIPCWLHVSYYGIYFLTKYALTAHTYSATMPWAGSPPAVICGHGVYAYEYTAVNQIMMQMHFPYIQRTHPVLPCHGPDQPLLSLQSWMYACENCLNQICVCFRKMLTLQAHNAPSLLLLHSFCFKTAIMLMSKCCTSNNATYVLSLFGLP